ncbi:VOC family protein [uncultured Victivallis sp.]|uniref:VOC family protein n=1 Tax=uncultured Victivallis sp. TaxID=354118 RepID=UPI0025D445F5|nr:VOC family protein [uncultured Victivallis sp.]
MNAAYFSLILKVNDLDGCRIFYRDLLGLGEPVFDSTFAVVFLLGEKLTLMLEKSAAEYLEHASAAANFAFAVPDLEEFARRLDDNGCPLEPDSIRIGIVEYRRGTDPEGNPFLVCQA